MERYTHSNIKKLFIVGDVHGEFKQLFHKIRTNVLKQSENNEQEKLVDDDTLKKLEPFFDEMPYHVSSKFYNYSYGLGKHLGVIENCVIIVAGDCGFGFNKEEYYHLYQAALKSAGPSLEKLFSPQRIKDIIERRFS